jgi:hypothetical protein
VQQSAAHETSLLQSAVKALNSYSDCAIFEQIPSGTTPTIELSWISKTSNCAKSANWLGISPVSRLEYNHKRRSPVKLPNSVGIDPVKVELVIEMEARSCKSPISDGILPVIVLLSNHKATESKERRKYTCELPLENNNFETFFFRWCVLT